MTQVSLEDYINRLQKQDSKYQWSLEKFGEKKIRRQEIQKEFPYVVTYCGHYGPGSLLDDLTDWCREKFGLRHGECQWRECEYSFDKWYHENKFEEEMDRLTDEKAGPRPDRKKKRAWSKWHKISGEVIDEQFKIIEARKDKPEEHSHKGIWTSFFVMKTGYDYGYEDFCFKNQEDVFYFKLMWAEDAEKRG